MLQTSEEAPPNASHSSWFLMLNLILFIIFLRDSKFSPTYFAEFFLTISSSTIRIEFNIYYQPFIKFVITFPIYARQGFLITLVVCYNNYPWTFDNPGVLIITSLSQLWVRVSMSNSLFLLSRRKPESENKLLRACKYLTINQYRDSLN